jgi:hypothetical protein
MIRHGKLNPSAVSTPFAAMDPCAPNATIAADTLPTSHMPCRMQGTNGQPSCLIASVLMPPNGGHAIADISRRSKSP